MKNSNLGTTLACGGTWDSTKFVLNKRSKVLCCMLQNRGRGFRFHCSEWYICYLRRIRCKQTCGHRFVLLSSGRGPGHSEKQHLVSCKKIFLHRVLKLHKMSSSLLNSTAVSLTVTENKKATGPFKKVKKETHLIFPSLSNQLFLELVVIFVILISSFDKTKVLCLLLHSCDVSHPAKRWDIHHQWTSR